MNAQRDWQPHQPHLLVSPPVIIEPPLDTRTRRGTPAREVLNVPDQDNLVGMMQFFLKYGQFRDVRNILEDYIYTSDSSRWDTAPGVWLPACESMIEAGEDLSLVTHQDLWDFADRNLDGGLRVCLKSYLSRTLLSVNRPGDALEVLLIERQVGSSVPYQTQVLLHAMASAAVLRHHFAYKEATLVLLAAIQTLPEDDINDTLDERPVALPQLELRSDLGFLLSCSSIDLGYQISYNAFDGLKAAWGVAHPKTLRAGARLALCLVFRGRAAQTLPLIENTIQRQKSVMGARHRDVCFSKAVRVAAFAAVSHFTMALRRLQALERLMSSGIFVPDVNYSALKELQDHLRNMLRGNEVPRSKLGHITWPELRNVFRMVEHADEIPLQKPEYAQSPMIKFPRALEAVFDRDLDALKRILGEYPRGTYPHALELECALHQTIQETTSENVLLSELCKHLSESRSNHHLIGEVLVVAAGRRWNKIVKVLMASGAKKVDDQYIINKSHVSDAIQVALALEEDKCLKELLDIDIDPVMCAFNDAVNEAVVARDFKRDLPLLICCMNEQWLQTTASGKHMDKTDLMCIQSTHSLARSTDWEMVCNVLDIFAH